MKHTTCRNFRVAVIPSILALALMAFFIIPPGSPADPSASKQDEDDASSVAEPSQEAIVESAVSLMQILAVMELQYFESEGDGSYGDFEELKDAGHVPAYQMPATYMNGYVLQWFFSEERTMFAIVAHPDDEDMPGLIVDSRGIVMETRDDEDSRGDFELVYGDFLDAMYNERDENDQFAFLIIHDYLSGDMALYIDEDDPSFPKLFLSSDNRSFMIFGVDDIGNGLEGGAYISSPEMMVLAIQFGMAGDSPDEGDSE